MNIGIHQDINVIWYNLSVLTYFASAILYVFLAFEVFRLRRYMARAIGVLLFAEGLHNFLQTTRYILFDGRQISAAFIFIAQLIPMAAIIYVLFALSREIGVIEGMNVKSNVKKDVDEKV